MQTRLDVQRESLARLESLGSRTLPRVNGVTTENGFFARKSKPACTQRENKRMSSKKVGVFGIFSTRIAVEITSFQMFAKDIDGTLRGALVKEPLEVFGCLSGKLFAPNKEIVLISREGSFSIIGIPGD